MGVDKASVHSFESTMELVTAIRAARASQQVKPNRNIDLIAPENVFKLATAHSVIVSSLAGLSTISESDDSTTGFAIPFDGETVYLASMFDEKDTQANTEKLSDEITVLEKRIVGLKDRLSNDSYISNAPEHVVQETRDMLAKAESDLLIAKEALQT
jgi:valyl-tRNA synthetase